MKLEYKSENLTIYITIILCISLFINFALKLRKILPFRVNCWFCNHNFWLPFPQRNSWNCPGCEQYNGFTKDGDYNRPLIFKKKEVFTRSPKYFNRAPASNGMCRMCNINQQLKVAQLANFVPMNENNYDNEVDLYRLQLEKAYKLCSSCKNMVKSKLHNEKANLLGSKLLQSRSPNKEQKKTEKGQTSNMTRHINLLLILIATILFGLSLRDVVLRYQSVLIPKTSEYINLLYKFIENIVLILKGKLFIAVPMLKDYEKILTSYKYDIDYKQFGLDFILSLSKLVHLNLIHKLLSLLGYFTQNLCQFINVDIVKYSSIFDLLWCINVLANVVETSNVDPSILLGLKVFSSSCLLISYNVFKQVSEEKVSDTNHPVPRKRMKNLSMGSNGLVYNTTDSSTTEETDDDVSLSKFGINNHSDSSNNNLNISNNSMPRVKSNLWAPQNDFARCTSSPYLVTNNNVFPAMHNSTYINKPEFSVYQNTNTADSDSDLDEGINGLNLGSASQKNKKNVNIFSVKKFDKCVSPSFTSPMAAHLLQPRPLISPSKMSHGTSWVAGGYWGGDATRQMYPIHGMSRSSSQSSGFESQTSSLHQRNIFSMYPPSREDSVGSELDKISVFSDPVVGLNRIYNDNKYERPSVFNNNMKSPIYPQMKYNSHISIPQSRSMWSPQNSSFSQYRGPLSVHNIGHEQKPYESSLPGLIRLPHINK